MTAQPQVIADLTADGADVDRLVADLDADQWALPTPAPDWTIAHQVAHLAATFRMAAMAAAEPDKFTELTGGLGPNFTANVTAALSGYLADPPAELLRRWRADRAAAETSIGALPMDRMVPWLVRPLPAAVLAMAGMMELFAHGQDIADTLGVRRQHTDRIGQIVGFGVRTWDFGYQSRGLETPDSQFRFEITAPSGALWEFGPDDSDQRISGPAEDFCLLITRRRHRDDLAVVAKGELADEWLDLAQAYRGPAGTGRRPGQFAALTR